MADDKIIKVQVVPPPDVPMSKWDRVWFVAAAAFLVWEVVREQRPPMARRRG